MNAQRLIIIAAALVMIAFAMKSYAGNYQIQFMWPGPTAQYDTVNVAKQLLVPCVPAAFAKPGDYFVEPPGPGDPPCSN